jgi:NADH dehydrogenase
VVIVGSGFGGLAAARRLEREPVDVVLLDRHNYHQFQPLLYQVATSGLNTADVAYAIRGVFRRQQRVVFRKADVVGVDWDAHEVRLRHEPPVPFDHLIVAAGSSTAFFAVPGAEDYAFPLYSLEDAVRLRNHVLSLFEAAAAVPSLVADGVLTFVVVGGGPTGVEVSGALAELVDKVLRQDFHDLDLSAVRIVLVEQGPDLLAAFGDRSRRYARSELVARGVEVRTGVAVEDVGPEQVRLSTGEVVSTRCLIWAAGVRANPLATALGVPVGRGGRVTVAPDLSLAEHPEAIAIGDIADIDDGAGGRLPQLAQVALQGGRHAAEQVLADQAGRPRSAFHYKDKGTMATIGRRAAVTEIPGVPAITGFIAWVAWLALHLVELLGVRNRVSVFVNWAWNYLTWDRGPRLILRPEALPHTPHPHADAPAPDSP